MKTIFRLTSYLFPNWFLVLAAVFFGAMTVASNVGLLATSALLIANAALHPPVLDLMMAIVGVRFFGISRAVLRYLERYVSHTVTFRLLSRIRVWFYASVEPLAPAGLSSYRSGDLLSRIVSDVDILKDFYLRVISPPLIALIIFGAVFWWLSYYQISLSFTFTFFYFLAAAVIPLLIRFMSRGLGRQVVEAKASIKTNLVDCVQGITEVLSFGQAERQSARVDNLSDKLLKLQKKLSVINGLTNALVGLAANLAMWSVLLLGIPMVTSLQIKGVHLAMLALGVLSSFEAVQSLPMVAHHLEHSIAAARRLFEITDTEAMVTDGSLSNIIGTGLCVSDLYFSYQQDNPWDLEDINFTLSQGKRLAIVGPSGSGKSTLINILLRFWEYNRGSVRLGNHEIKEYNLIALRSKIGVVTQHTYLFNTTIRDNIMLANTEASEEQVEMAAKRARIHDFIMSLPQGYDTYIGEQGHNISGGQRQRIAIARALLKDAPLLILDEATTGLDAVTEREVIESIHELMEGRTTLVITHKLTGLEDMDEILVMDRGRIVERGKLQELLQQNGLFFKMWDLSSQALNH